MCNCFLAQQIPQRKHATPTQNSLKMLSLGSRVYHSHMVYYYCSTLHRKTLSHLSSPLLMYHTATTG